MVIFQRGKSINQFALALSSGKRASCRTAEKGEEGEPRRGRTPGLPSPRRTLSRSPLPLSAPLPLPPRGASETLPHSDGSVRSQPYLPGGSAGLRIALLGRAPPARPPLPTAPSGSGAPRPPAPPELWLRAAPQPLGHSRPSPRGGGGGEARVAVPPARVLAAGGRRSKGGSVSFLPFPPHPAPGGAGGAPRAEAAAGGSWIKKRKMSL